MSEYQFPGTIDDAMRARAIRAAQGETSFDLLVVGGTIVDVITGELRLADIGVTGAMIASVQSVRHSRGRRGLIRR